MNSEFYMFAAIGLILTLLALWTVVAPLWRGQRASQTDATDIDIYKDQLKEVDRDLARGVLDPAEAERTRTEISRRLLNADAQARAASTDAPPALSRGVAIVLALCLLGGATFLYAGLGAPGYGDVPRAERIALGEERRNNRPGQLEAERDVPDTLDQFDEQTRTLIQQRRALVFEQPTNIQGWRVLAQTEAAIGQYQRATRAQERVVALKGDDATIEDSVTLLDLMVASTQGYVSPEAETIALSVLREDADNIPAIYYAGLMYAQNDRPDRAFRLWRRVVEEGAQGTLHWEFAAGQIEDVALQLGMDYVVPERRGPTDEDLEMAQDLSPEDRRAMIEGMVGQLADRLSTEGGPPQDWARLISSLAVLGQPDAARTVLSEAETVFGGDVQAVQILRRAAEEAGL